jgi:hypothetical protein
MIAQLKWKLSRPATDVEHVGRPDRMQRSDGTSGRSAKSAFQNDVMPFANTSPFRGYASALRFSRQHGMFFVGTCCLGFDGTGPCETGLALF